VLICAPAKGNAKFELDFAAFGAHSCNADFLQVFCLNQGNALRLELGLRSCWRWQTEQ